MIVGLSGTAGVGKTTLALHWAHQVAARFPDGQLYVNLRGFDGATALGTSVVLRRFIGALGVPAGQIPSGVDARAALFRSLLADKRVLVVLDNARDAEHVQPLFPGTAGSMVIVTSRTTLVGLVATADAHHLALDVLSTEDARALLAARIGSDVVAAQPGPVDEIITRCARVPLALAIASARMSADPARLAAELRASGGTLDAFHLPETTVETVLSWSYRVLREPSARLFRMVGCHPGADLTESAAASLAFLDPTVARQCLRELVDANLLAEHHPGRYTCHDLLRAYAAQQGRGTDSDADRVSAVERVVDHYAQSAHAADRLVYPARPPVVLSEASPGVVRSDLPDATAAWKWLAAERDNLLAALDLAVERGWRLTAWRIAWAMSTLLQRQGHPQDLYRSWRRVLAVLDDSDPVPMRTIALRQIAEACARMHQFDEAVRFLHEAARLVDEAQWLAEKAGILRTLARTYGRQGDDRAAYEHASQSLAIYRTLYTTWWDRPPTRSVGTPPASENTAQQHPIFASRWRPPERGRTGWSSRMRCTAWDIWLSKWATTTRPSPCSGRAWTSPTPTATPTMRPPLFGIWATRWPPSDSPTAPRSTGVGHYRCWSPRPGGPRRTRYGPPSRRPRDGYDSSITEEEPCSTVCPWSTSTCTRPAGPRSSRRGTCGPGRSGPLRTSTRRTAASIRPGSTPTWRRRGSTRRWCWPSTARR